MGTDGPAARGGSNDASHAAGKLAVAVESLVGSGDLVRRLSDAFLVLHPVHAGDFPDAWQRPGWERPCDLRAEYQGIHAALTTKRSVEETLVAMAEGQAEEIARRLLRLERDMREYCRSLSDTSDT